MSTPGVLARGASLADFVELTKPRITTLVVLTSLVGFVMGSSGPAPAVPLLWALVGTGLVAAGASALNMVLERDTDARMHRTRTRPLASGRMRAPEAVAFGLGLTAIGLAVLFSLCGALPAAVAFVTWFTYLFCYTPLKRRTSLSTLVGAVPGALPPVIGWAAARGTIDGGAFVLFAILYLWQVPHFLAIAWIYREAYARGGLPMLPVVDTAGRLTGRQAVAHAFALLLVSLLPTGVGMAGRIYLGGALLLGAALLGFSLRLALLRTIPAARGLFLASVVYLTALCALLVADRL
jgi:protoheme IX farnesyltransferase